MENTSKRKLKKDLKGFFFTGIKYKGKQTNARIAAFKIIDVKNNTVKAKVIQWGRGWKEKDIKGAVIDDGLVENAIKILEWINTGIDHYKKGYIESAKGMFIKVLKEEPRNKIALAWLNKLNKEEISRELTRKMNFPADFQYLLYLADRVYLNCKGYWEAVLKGIVMIYIPAGNFFNGDNRNHEDEGPEHNVYLTGYWISKYEISFWQFDRFCKEVKREYPDDEDFGRGNYPVYNVSWYDAAGYCEWLSQKTGLNFKLPTEAQWEKAARGTDRRNFPWGFHEPFHKNQSYANYRNKRDGYPFHAPVKSFINGASPYGVINLCGNTAEWTNDWYDAGFYSGRINENPLGAKKGTLKVTRGGSYISLDFSLRVTNREPLPPEEKNNHTGFRIVLLKNE